MKKSVLVGSDLGSKNEILSNGEFRKSICDQNCTPKKTQAKRIFSATLHVAVFDESSTDRKRTLSPIDPCQSRQKRSCRDRFTKITNPCCSPFFVDLIVFTQISLQRQCLFFHSNIPVAQCGIPVAKMATGKHFPVAKNEKKHWVTSW